VLPLATSIHTLATLAIGVLRPIDVLLEAYRSGGGCRSRRTVTM
jgi:hypothetical protein